MKKYLRLCILLCLLLHSNVQAQIYPSDLAKGRSRWVVPFEYQNHFIVVKLRFHGVLPLQFIFDTGSEYTLLFKKAYTDILGLEYQKRIPILGADQTDSLNALICRHVRLELASLPSVRQDILVLEEDIFNFEQITGTPIDGILGTQFFRNCIVEIDYRRKQLILRDPEGYAAPGSFEEIPVHFKNNKPYTSTETQIFRDSILSLELLFDTGAGLPLMLHNNTDPRLRLPEKTITGRIGMGLGGLMKGFIGRIESFRLGPYEFNGLITSFQDLEDPMIKNETKSRNGLIGNQLLSKFTVIIDFPRNRLYLKANRFIKQKIRYDRSGLTLFAVGPDLRQFIVQDVVPGSPADRAGILAGDRIVRYGWKPAEWLSLDRLVYKLQGREGKKIRLEVLRQGEKLKKVLYLQDLL